jgi:hypothetical protein
MGSCVRVQVMQLRTGASRIVEQPSAAVLQFGVELEPLVQAGR